MKRICVELENKYKKILVVWDVEDYKVWEEVEKEYGINVVFIEDYIHSLIEKGCITGSRDDVLHACRVFALTTNKLFIIVNMLYASKETTSDHACKSDKAY